MFWKRRRLVPLIVLTFEINASVSSTSSSTPSNLATACRGYSSATETPSVSSIGINTMFARCNIAARMRKITCICWKGNPTRINFLEINYTGYHFEWEINISLISVSKLYQNWTWIGQPTSSLNPVCNITVVKDENIVL